MCCDNALCNKMFLYSLTFRMFQHTSSEVNGCNSQQHLKNTKIKRETGDKIKNNAQIDTSESGSIFVRCLCTKFVTTVCFLFLLKLEWPKNRNIYIRLRLCWWVSGLELENFNFVPERFSLRRWEGLEKRQKRKIFHNEGKLHFTHGLLTHDK